MKSKKGRVVSTLEDFTLTNTKSKKLKLSPPKIEQFYDSIKSSINSKANKKSIRPIKQIEKLEKSTIFHFSLHKIKEL